MTAKRLRWLYLIALLVALVILGGWRINQAHNCEDRGGKYVTEWSGWTCVAPQP